MGAGEDGDQACGGNNKDPAIKLFGRTIALPESLISVRSQKTLDHGNYVTEVKHAAPRRENSLQPEKNPYLDDDEENQTSMPTSKAESNTKPQEEQEDSNSADQEKVFKKPDKILPCPRCNSTETKFCYFNNYNMKQPRHFCKNCQRYWTAGGTMRNVPVGAGRRRNKHLASQYRQILVSGDGVQTTRLETPESAHHQVTSAVESSASFRPSTGNDTVLKFGPETPLCESMENVLSLRDQKRCVEIGSSLDEPSSLGSTSTEGNELPESVVERERVNFSGSCNGVNAQTKPHCYPVPPLGFPLNPGGSEIFSNPNLVPCYPATMHAVQGYCPSGVPLQFVPATTWGSIGLPVWTSAHGNLTLGTSNGCPSPTSSTSNNSCCSANSSPALGKHSRDMNFIDDDEKSEKCVLIPKTLRTDDPKEGSKSLMRTTLGIKPHHKECISKSTNFERFERKSEILEANPTTLSRVYNFQEST